MSDMKRRDFLRLLGGTAIIWPAAALAQARTDRPLIAYLGGQTQFATAPLTAAFLQGLRELGHAEGRDIEVVYRFADGNNERLPGLAEELVGLKPAIILATSVICTVAAKKATATIPIVTPALADAVHLGLVASVNRPGGNVTGITPYVAGLPAKQFELAREVMPGARRLGILGDRNDPKAPLSSKD